MSNLLQEDDACQSAPASPRRTPKPPASTVTKVTSELFSTDSDISRSLELVYKEPREEDQRRKLSARYRHNSSCSANSDGSISSDKAGTAGTAGSHTPAPKLEKRKPSVTQLRQRSKSRSRSPQKSEQSQSRAESRGAVASRPSTETSTHSAETPYDLQHQPSKPLTATTSFETAKTSFEDKKTEVTEVAAAEQVTLPSEKAQPSPTKVTKPCPPSISSLKEQSSDEIITPSLEVECHKPDQTAQPVTGAATAAVTIAAESCQAKSLDKAGKVYHGKSSP